MSYYYYVVFIAISVAIIMLKIIFGNDWLQIEKKRMWAILYLIIISGVLLEWGESSLDGSLRYSRYFLMILKAIEHSIAPFISVLLIAVLDLDKKIIKYIIPLCIHTVLQFAFFMGKNGIFYLDNNNVYHHGNLYWIFTAVSIIYILILIYRYIQFGRKIQNESSSTFLIILMFFLSVLILNWLVIEVYVYYSFIAINSVFVYIDYVEIMEKTDVMTGLLNRRSYNSYISKINKNATVIYMDVDNFKNVNDSYGHSYGDDCIQRLGIIIARVYSKYGKCYRIGGDEFCVIIREETSLIIEKLNEKFMGKIRKEIEKDNRFPDVSLGYAAFDSENNEMETVVCEADENMYTEKNRKKNNH